MAYEGLDSPPPPRPPRPGGSALVPIAFWLSVLSFAVCGLTSPISYVLAGVVWLRETRKGRRPHLFTYYAFWLSVIGMGIPILVITMDQLE